MPVTMTRIAGLVGVLVCAGAGCASVAHRADSAAGMIALADSSAVVRLAPGVTHTFLRDDRGPWAVHVVELDTRVCTPILDARKPGPPLGERALTSVLAADALAGINADFFMLPGGTTVGAHVSDGVALIGPTDRPVFGVTMSGAWRIGRARITGYAHVKDDSAAVAQVNRPARAFSAWRGLRDGITLFTTWAGDSVAADSAARRIVVNLIEGDESAGSGVVAVSDPATTATQLRGGSALMLAYGDARRWAARRTPGDTVTWSVAVAMHQPSPAADAVLTEAVGGFPELLRGGRAVLAEQTVAASFGAQRHPRSAVGWTPDSRLLLVTVDGRQPGWSAGMSLDELTWLFQSLGASHAINLDGGGSTAMIVNGVVANRPSDRQGERAVGNALVLEGCREAAAG